MQSCDHVLSFVLSFNFQSATDSSKTKPAVPVLLQGLQPTFSLHIYDIMVLSKNQIFFNVYITSWQLFNKNFTSYNLFFQFINKLGAKLLWIFNLPCTLPTGNFVDPIYQWRVGLWGGLIKQQKQWSMRSKICQKKLVWK